MCSEKYVPKITFKRSKTVFFENDGVQEDICYDAERNSRI